MDTDHMRRVLAEKGMGWIEVPVSVRQPAEHGYFFVDSDPPQKCCKAGVYYYAQGRWIRDCGWDLWEPDISWPQCGLVIEAMREKGWCWDGSFTDEGSVWCSWWCVTDDGDVSDDTSFSGVGDTFTEAVCYVAAMAIEGWEL